MRPECNKVCSTYKVLHDLNSKQDTQGLHFVYAQLKVKLYCLELRLLIMRG